MKGIIEFNLDNPKERAIYECITKLEYFPMMISEIIHMIGYELDTKISDKEIDDIQTSIEKQLQDYSFDDLYLWGIDKLEKNQKKNKKPNSNIVKLKKGD